MSSPFSIFDRPSAFVAHWFEINNIKYTAAGQLQNSALVSKPGLSVGTLNDYVWLDYLEAAKQREREVRSQDEHDGKKTSYRLERFRRSDLDSALNIYREEAAETYKEGLRLQLKHRPELIEASERGLSRFLDALCGEGAWSKLDLAVLQHFCWQTKRKLFGNRALYHMMPVFVGRKQGTGKSTIVRHHLCAPLKEVTIEKEVSDLSRSEKEWPALTNNFICFLDELAGARLAEIETLKSLITKDTIDVRIYHTQSQKKAPMTATFIGTSNRDISEMIRDSTGMRRYWSINCASSMNWEIVESLNYLEIWQGINENLAKGEYVSSHWESISAHQEAMVTQDPIEMSIESLDLRPSPLQEKVYRRKGTELAAEINDQIEKIGGHRKQRPKDIYTVLKRLQFTTTVVDNATYFYVIKAPRSSGSAGSITEEKARQFKVDYES